MRNIAIAILVVLGFIWLFFSNIYLSDNEYHALEVSDIKTAKVTSKQNIAVVDVKKLALLLGVEYQEEIDVAEVVISSTLDVELEIVVIYTSEDNHKVRIRKVVDGEKTQFDMVLGDKIYDYTLTAINPSSAELDNGEYKVTLKVFKTTIISVTDLPKEVSDSL